MRFQVGDLVGDVAVPVGMALIEGVVGELLHGVEEFVTQLLAVPRGLTAPHEGGPLLRHEFAVLLAARLAKVVCVGQRVPGELLGHPHYRLLIDHQSVSVRQEFLSIGVEELDLLTAVLPIGVVVVHVGGHRARPVQRHKGGHVLECRRCQ